MIFNIKEFDDVKKTSGGRKVSSITFGKAGFFRLNKPFIKEHELDEVKSVKIKSKKEGNKIIVAFTFLNEEDKDTFSVSFAEEEFNVKKSLSFSGRSIFLLYNMTYKSFMQNKKKSIRLEHTIQNSDGKKYFVVEMLIK